MKVLVREKIADAGVELLSSRFDVDVDPKSDLASWGDPAAAKDGIGTGQTTIDLNGRSGGAILIWITNLGHGSPDDAGRFHAQIAEVTVNQQ